MAKRHLPANVTRRDVLRYTMAGAGLTALGSLSRGFIRPAEGAPIQGLKRLVVIFASGGYDGLSLVVPYSNSAYYTRRPNISIPPPDAANPAAALALSGTNAYGFHPRMLRLQGLWNAGQCAAIRKVGYPQENLSHFESTDIYGWGVRGGFGALPIDPSGWIARTSDNMNLSATGAVGIGVGRPLELEGAEATPLLVSNLSSFAFQQSSNSAAGHAHRMTTIQAVLDGYSGSTLDHEAAEALDQGMALADSIQVAVQSYTSTAVYPSNSPGSQLRDVARLIQGGFDSQIFFTGIGGFDTHGDQGNGTGFMANLVDRLDQAIGAFADDMVAMGTWNDTVVLVISEFGRRNFQNTSAGTDHGHGNQFIAAGGPLNGGLYGPDITESEIANTSWLGYNIDFRDIYRNLVTNHLGGNGNAVFPEAQQFNNNVELVS